MVRGAVETISGAGWIGLREWADDLGTVTWDAGTNTAAVELGDTQYEFHVESGVVIRHQPGEPSVEVSLNFMLQQNRIYLLQTEADALVPHTQKVA